MNAKAAAALAIDADADKSLADPLLAAGQQPIGCRFIHGVVSRSPLDDPQAGGWRYCQRPQAPGSHYCGDHAALVRGRAFTPIEEGGALHAFVVSARGTPSAIAVAANRKFGVGLSTRKVAAVRAAAREGGLRKDPREGGLRKEARA